MIKKIFAIADLHIPNDEKLKPYGMMLKKFLAQLLQETKKYDKDEFRIVLCGDIFHNKIKTTNEARATFHSMLNYLNAMGKTIIIAGNHDMLENNHDRIDSISPTFDIKNVYPNITYADKILNYKSGYIVDDNVIWALYSMYDNFAKPNIEDSVKGKDTRIIGLYHGEIVGATTDTGRMCESGVDFKDFKICDCVIAGHIHKFQEIKKNGVPIVYCGSLFQRDSGENTTGHGFVEWDLEDMSYKLIEVPNEYRIFKFKIKSFDDVKDDVEKIINL